LAGSGRFNWTRGPRPQIAHLRSAEYAGDVAPAQADGLQADAGQREFPSILKRNAEADRPAIDLPFDVGGEIRSR
jgi:hypothetical protein